MLTAEEIHALSREAMRLPLADVVVSLSDTLSPKIVAFMCGKNNVLVLSAWVSGKERITQIENLRLRYGYIAAEIIRRNYCAETARAIFMGMNRVLGDEAPASWLRDHENEKDLKLVVSAALNDEMCS